MHLGMLREFQNSERTVKAKECKEKKCKRTAKVKLTAEYMDEIWETRARLFSKLEKQEGCTLADLVNEYESIIGLKEYSNLPDDMTHHAVNAVQRGNRRQVTFLHTFSSC